MTEPRKPSATAAGRTGQENTLLVTLPAGQCCLGGWVLLGAVRGVDGSVPWREQTPRAARARQGRTG